MEYNYYQNQNLIKLQHLKEWNELSGKEKDEINEKIRSASYEKEVTCVGEAVMEHLLDELLKEGYSEDFVEKLKENCIKACVKLCKKGYPESFVKKYINKYIKGYIEGYIEGYESEAVEMLFRVMKLNNISYSQVCDMVGFSETEKNKYMESLIKKLEQEGYDLNGNKISK